MTKYCPMMVDGNKYCMKEMCAWWDEERSQCCMLTQALAAAGKAPVTPVIMQPAVTTTPTVTLNSSGDWVNPNSYRIDCTLEKEVIQ